MELRRLSPPKLLQRHSPVLLTFRAHLNTLTALIPSALSEREVVDDDAAFNLDKESETLQGRFVEPGLLCAMQTLRLLLDSKQLHDDASQATLLKVLSKFGDEPHNAAPNGHPLETGQSQVSLSQAPPPSSADGGVTDPIAACTSAFDYFDVLFSNLPSVSLQSELLSLCKAIVDMMARHTSSDASPPQELLDRKGRIADLASSCLQRDRSDDRGFETWKDKKPLPKLVKTLFDVQAAYHTSPRELLKQWACEWLPELDEPSVDDDEPMQLDGCPLFNKTSAPHVISTLFSTLTEEAKALKLPTPDAWKRCDKKGSDSDPPLEADEASDLITELKDLSEAFVMLVKSTTVISSTSLNKTCITHSARFINLINKKVLPMMVFHFKSFNQVACAFLKSLQPATRLLQVHCSLVKSRQHLAALNQAASLKKELESLIFEVKVLLQTHNVRETFWMGNLKHKDLQGKETSSQMQVELPKAKGKKRKAEEELVEEVDDDEEEALLPAADDDEEDEEEGEEEQEEEEEY